jgi:hypothetical protein
LHESRGLNLPDFPFPKLTKPYFYGSFLNAPTTPPLTPRTKKEQCSSYVPVEEADMLKVFVEEAAALASITLFVGMIAVWAQLISQL